MEFVMDYTIHSLFAENQKLRNQLAQLKHHNTEKGQLKMSRNNQARRLKTAFKKVLKELLRTYSSR